MERRVRKGQEGGEIRGTTIRPKTYEENKIKKRNKRQRRREMLFSPLSLWDVLWVYFFFSLI